MTQHQYKLTNHLKVRLHLLLEYFERLTHLMPLELLLVIID